MKTDQGSNPESQAPAISLPKGGGAIRGIGEKFAANPVTGTASLTVPIAVSPGRSDFSPKLALAYDSGAGNGVFGFGWKLSLPSITRKTDKGLPRYLDADDSDVFILSEAEDLVPVLNDGPHGWETDVRQQTFNGVLFNVKRYRPRVENLFARIERWTRFDDGDTHWRSISRDNLLTIYGKDEQSRVFNPANKTCVFSWLISETQDDRGNAIVYEYVADNSAELDLTLANELNRGDESSKIRSTNRYLKRIKYGNRTSLLDQSGRRNPFINQNIIDNSHWFFEVLFDYGEGHYEEPDAAENGQHLAKVSLSPKHPWSSRSDPFSRYCSGFEVRTYRLCQRVLMFHHFPTELGTNDYLVRSTDFDYKATPVASFIASVTQSGYIHQNDDTYLKKSLPSLDFEYSEAVIQNEIHTIDAGSLENLPSGLYDDRYQLTDLDGEGISGILTEQAGTWFYKPGIGEARFGPLQVVTLKPSTARLTGGQQLMDLGGDGQLDLVQLTRPLSGFYERTEQAGWSDFHPFSSLPELDWTNPNLRLVDLTGDGHADVLISEDEVLTWYPSLGEDGFGPGDTIPVTLDEEQGPRVVFANGTQSIFLSDMSGDGLPDLVRIRNGEVCYWPNLGYGHFGAKISMDDAPWFESAELFDHRRLRLADIDGSGTTDIIYLHRDGVRIYLNQSGNSWSSVRSLPEFPPIDNFASASAVDLLGNGTACLVWSSSLPEKSREPMRYVDLMGGQKPHLLISAKNNLGAETKIEYASSTKFYLQDKFKGNPWITRLPFPVHVVEQVETVDRVSRNRFVTRYVYHHGHFDGSEREFRGFGMVEQFDTEELTALSSGDQLPLVVNFDQASQVPPVHTKTWFHTGAYIGREHISDFFAGIGEGAGEYYREPGLTDDQANALLLDDTILPPALMPDEEREAARALKGSILRQEIYALDDNVPESSHPYSVSERNYNIESLQPRAINQHAVFFVQARETIDYHYERQPTDPRTSHAITLEVDEFGNVLRALSIGYGRRHRDPNLELRDQDQQVAQLSTYTENSFTKAIDQEGAYRVPLPYENRVYELTAFKPEDGHTRFNLEEFSAQGFQRLDAAKEIPYEETASQIVEEKRLIETGRTLYRRDDLVDRLPFGEAQSLALVFDTYKLAFTPGLRKKVYQRQLENQAIEDLLPDATAMRDEAGYVDLDNDGNWWIPSGRVFFHPDPKATPDIELDHATKHFFLPSRYRDPFGNESLVSYDEDQNGLAYDLLVSKTRDALANEVEAVQNYRVLQPKMVTDPNGNRTAAEFDALGMVVGIATMGKAGESEGDSLAGFEVEPDPAISRNHLQDPFTNPHEILRHATTRLLYDLHRYEQTSNSDNPQPSVVYTLTRETHEADLQPQELTKIQHTFSYSDGFGREIQRKIQAEAGPVINEGPEVSPRWVSTGWVVFNNKGKAVRQYEPFFSATHQFEFGKRAGVSPILFYDPVERVVATLHPNHTYEKVVFDSWQQENWDVNDTVELNPAEDPDVGAHFDRLPDETYLPTWLSRREAGTLGPHEKNAALKAQVHARTPTIAFFDTLGRTFLTVIQNRYQRNENGVSVTSEEKFATRVTLDIEGNERATFDAQDRLVMRYDYDMLGNRIHQASMEAGERWMFNSIAGKPIRNWDSRGFTRTFEYDKLLRQNTVRVTGNELNDCLAERIVYGEDTNDGPPEPTITNHRGKIFKVFDGAGTITNDLFDFKGNLRASTRQLAVDYHDTVNWSLNVPLEGESFPTSTTFDALNRPLTLTAPDNSVVRLIYNEANLLERLEVNLRGRLQGGERLWTTFVSNIDYNAKGQREVVEQGEKLTSTTYKYDAETLRLLNLTTKRTGDGAELQNLSYTYDPIGNITHIQDDADIQNVIYFQNQRVEPSADYTYDAAYRLIEATGREHLGQNRPPPVPSSPTDAPRVGLLHPGDGRALGTYFQQYVYDEVGNILQMIHRSVDPANPGWTRNYSYEEPSLLQPNKDKSNRLSRTTIGNTQETYGYDAGLGGHQHGFMTSMPHLPLMRWNYRDELHATAQQVLNNGGTPETTYYVYDSSGQRVRKVTDNATDQNATPARRAERIYLGAFEVYREYQNGNVVLKRETLHVMDDKRRVALVETKTVEANAPLNTLPDELTRYQFDNHLGSAALELDDLGAVISYEEYYPYGSTSYQAGRNVAEVSLKRYRYAGKERDSENGFYYIGVRYYPAWLGRWMSCDPAGPIEGLNLFLCNRANPIGRTDPTGMASDETAIKKDLAKHATKLETMKDDLIWATQRVRSAETDVAQRGLDLVNTETSLLTGNATKDQVRQAEQRLSAASAELKAAQGEVKSLNELLATTSRKVSNLEARLRKLAGAIGAANAEKEIEFIRDEAHSAAAARFINEAEKRSPKLQGGTPGGGIGGAGALIALIIGAIAISSTVSSVSSFDVKSPPGKVGSDNPPNMRDTLQTQLDVSLKLADAVQNTPSAGNALAAGTLAVGAIPALGKMASLNAAELYQLEMAERGIDLTPISNAPYMIDEATGQVYKINMDAYSPDQGKLTPAFKLEKWSMGTFYANGQGIWQAENGSWIYHNYAKGSR